MLSPFRYQRFEPFDSHRIAGVPMLEVSLRMTVGVVDVMVMLVVPPQVPEKEGETNGAKPAIDAPEGMVTVPVKVGEAKGAYVLAAFPPKLDALIEVLQDKPLEVVYRRADDAVEHEGRGAAVGAAVPEVSLARKVFAPMGLIPVIVVQPKPVPEVHVRAFPAPEQLGTATAVGEALPAVALATTVLAA